MVDYINKNKLKDALRNLYRYESFPITDIEQLFDSIPVMDMEFVRHGHWMGESQTKFGKLFSPLRVFKCSVCGNYLDFDGVNAGRGSANFCPNCGAKMDESREEEPEINPCRGCEDYDGKGGCLSNGGCGEGREDGNN